ncbi:uncharacterized protein LOC112589702 [Harpegnathos saltator]|uniref:uncharacterized protein LOC112589702 n=1 Tax=Harpegnathos saltator TaxID=610380 RepID=UPI000DBEDAC2|nr:uncharacterized protein LOC112589702 [Harpegnathos saltator]
MCVVHVVREYPLSSSRLCPLPWEFAERKCNFWLVRVGGQLPGREKRAIFKETMPGAELLAPSHKYSVQVRRNRDTRGIGPSTHERTHPTYRERHTSYTSGCRTTMRDGIGRQRYICTAG